MINNLIAVASSYTSQLINHALHNSANDSSYKNYIQYISADTQKLEQLVKQYPSSILFHNPKLLLSTAQYIVDSLRKISNLSQLHKTPIYFDIPCPDKRRAISLKWWQYQLNKVSRRDYEMLNYHFEKVSSKKAKYASNLQVRNYILRQQATAKWMNRTFIQNDGITLSLAKCSKSNYAQNSETFTILKGLGNYADSLTGYDWTFITLTAPLEFHSSPKYGDSKWDGSSAINSHNYLQKGWHRSQSILYKNMIHHFGIKVSEPHQDGCSHFHLIVWHKKNEYDAIVDAFSQQFSPKQIKFRRNNGMSCASSYIAKYIRKSDDYDPSSPIVRVASWRCCWGIRSFRFFGIDNQITKWRELRKIEHDTSAIWKAAKAGDFASYLSLLSDSDTTLLKQSSINKYGERYKKVIGI